MSEFSLSLSLPFEETANDVAAMRTSAFESRIACISIPLLLKLCAEVYSMFDQENRIW